MTSISIETAAAVTERSKSTWYRRLADGGVSKVEGDGKRTMLSLADVTPMMAVAMAGQDLEYLLRADSGDAEAQDDMGQIFLAAGKQSIGVYWLELAAQQNYPNAMQRLGQCYAAGEGVPRDENLAIMWLAKAASHGHAIAQAQIQNLRPRA